MNPTINAAATLGRKITATALMTTPAMVFPTSIHRHLRATSVADIGQILCVASSTNRVTPVSSRRDDVAGNVATGPVS
jgi:hypothetical protein